MAARSSAASFLSSGSSRAEHRAGVVELAHLHVGLAEVLERLRVVRPELERAVVRLDRLRVLPLLAERVAEAVPRLRERLALLDRRLVGLGRLPPVLLLLGVEPLLESALRRRRHPGRRGAAGVGPSAHAGGRRRRGVPRRSPARSTPFAFVPSPLTPAGASLVRPVARIAATRPSLSHSLGGPSRRAGVADELDVPRAPERRGRPRSPRRGPRPPSSGPRRRAPGRRRSGVTTTSSPALGTRIRQRAGYRVPSRGLVHRSRRPPPPRPARARASCRRAATRVPWLSGATPPSRWRRR